ncbi:MAG: OmpH family outer membrane protein [Bacteroidales bacterium]|nr:OmpH family outer membrane protein [Bacteroidales bacterium]
MKKILTIILVALTFSAFSAQLKLGHINSAELMRMMPELEQAEQRLQQEVREAEAAYGTMITEFQNLMQEFEANQHQWSDLIRNTRLGAIQDLQRRIQEFEQQSQRELQFLQESLMTPIIERARTAIEDVARENGFTYIFDTSGGMLLFAADSDDILPLVKRRLNLN